MTKLIKKNVMNVQKNLRPLLIVVAISLLLASCKKDVKEVVPGTTTVSEVKDIESSQIEAADVQETASSEETEKAKKAMENGTAVEASKTAKNHVFGSITMPDINVKGSIKQIMTGDFEKTGSLSELKGMKNIYAVGELEGLLGSVQVFNGRSFVARTNDQEIETEETFEEDTALLVYTQVKQWRKIKIPKQVQSVGQFRIFIMQQARALGIEVTEPFPFMIEGNMRKLNFHIVHWNPEHPKDNNSFYFQSGYQAVMYNQEIQMFGFYSEPDDGNYLLDKQNFHAHFVTENEKFAGHVDDVFLGEGMSLKLPIK